MSVHIFGAVLAALVIVLPYLLQLYIQRLPFAPECPTCRSVTRAVISRWPAIEQLPSLAATHVGECHRCGWRGRMRWRWATGRVRGDHRD